VRERERERERGRGRGRVERMVFYLMMLSVAVIK
jgi:hypothetical protein